MKKIFLFGLFSCITMLALAQAGKKTIYAFKNKFSIEIPDDVDTMTAEQVQTKYHKNKDPKIFYYANQDLSFSIVISAIAEDILEADMIKHKDELAKDFAVKGVKLDKNEVRQIGDHDVIVVSFSSDTPDSKILNRRFFAVAGGKLIMGTFNCTESESRTRLPQIDESINSIQIK